MKRSTNLVVDLKDKQLEILAVMNSWVFSRLVAENERAGESLASMMDAVAESEREQGRSLLSRFLLPCLPGTHAPHSESPLFFVDLCVRTSACTAGELRF